MTSKLMAAPTGDEGSHRAISNTAHRLPLATLWGIKERLVATVQRMMSPVVRSGAEMLAVARERNAEIISVDLFDTLVYRRCASPAVVFDLQFQKIADLLPKMTSREWTSLRRGAERTLSERDPTTEISLAAIYEDISQRLGLDRKTTEAAMRAELEAESRVIRPYRGVVSTLRSAHAEGRKIIFTTDTYQPQNFVHDLLASIVDFDFTLLCSSETGCTKRHGAAFRLLREQAGSQRLIHFGDNLRSDVVRARASHVEACLARWTRASFLDRNRDFLTYAAQQGILEFDTPDDDDMTERGATERAQDEIAWRWAFVFSDVLTAADEAAKRFGVDEIWLLSRDFESVNDVREAARYPLFSVPTRYVFTSRAASYPIAAVDDPNLFERWYERKAAAQDKATGMDLISAYRGLAGANATRVLILDSGWKGRIQAALQRALSPIDVFGFYFSLSWGAEAESRARSCVFMPFDRRLINKAAVEALAGYRGGSCLTYCHDGNGWRPVFKAEKGDVAPEYYAGALRKWLTMVVRARGKSTAVSSRTRRRVMRRLFAFPDHVTATAFESWGIGNNVAGNPSDSLLRGGGAARMVRLRGRELQGNLWPELAVWSLTNRREIVALLQVAIHIRRWVMSIIMDLGTRVRRRR